MRTTRRSRGHSSIPTLTGTTAEPGWSRRPWAVLTGAVLLTGLLVVIAFELPTRPPDEAPWQVVPSLVLGPVVYGAAAVTGFYIGARRELAGSCMAGTGPVPAIS